MTVVETNKVGNLQKCMDFKPREEAHDDEDITVKSIATAFQFGMALGFAKKYDKIDKVIEEVKKAITLEQKKGKWIRKVLGSTNKYGTTIMYQCTNCKKISVSKYKFCPNCGARMRDEDKE